VVTRTDDGTGQRDFDLPVGTVTAVGLTLGLLGMIYLVTHPEPLLVWMFEGTIVAAPTACPIYGGHWLAARSSDRSDRWLAAGWTLSGAAITSTFVTGFVLGEQLGGVPVAETEQLALFGALSGAFVAFLTVVSIRFQSQVPNIVRPNGTVDVPPLIVITVSRYRIDRTMACGRTGKQSRRSL